MDRELMISPDPVEIDLPVEEEQNPQQPQQPAGQVPITIEALLDHIKTLTNNQNELIGTIKHLKAKAEDPFLQFKTPDPIKNLCTFSGNKKEAHAWIQDAEKTLGLFRSYRNEIIYPQLVRAVKNKIIGDAREILIAAGNPEHWEEIKEVILNSFSDRRDLTSHIQSLFYITQERKTVSEYYNQVKTIDTAIKTTAATLDDYKDSTRAINSLVSLMTVTRFIDGLNEELSMHVRSCSPKTLEDAFTVTTEYANAAYRQKLNRRSANDRQNPSSNMRSPHGSKNHARPSNSNNLASNGNRQPNPNQNNNNNFYKPAGSGKFKSPRAVADDDVSMRTAKSRTDVNNHQQDDDIEPDTHQLDNSTLDSEDDEYFIDDELNFQVEEEIKTRK